jgi:ATP-binding cassette subfamily B protein
LDNEDVTLNNGNFVPTKIEGAIEFNKVQFAYDPPTWVLKEVSFKVDAGKTIALVGHTGSGKTSIISILNRLCSISSWANFIGQSTP